MDIERVEGREMDWSVSVLSQCLTILSIKGHLVNSNNGNAKSSLVDILQDFSNARAPAINYTPHWET